MLGNEWAESMKSLSSAYASMYEKKKDCKDGYHWCPDEKKCMKDKKRGMAHGYIGGHHDHDDNEDGGDGGDGGVSGGGDGGGGGGE